MRFRAFVLVAALCLLVPAVAIAQSAGDEQYSDPFGGNSPSSSSGSSGSSGSSSSPAPGGSSGQLAQNSSGDSSTSDSSEASDTQSSGSGLPRTGSDSWLLALMGALMLLGGLFLRLGLRPLPTRAGGSTPQTLGREIRLTPHRR